MTVPAGRHTVEVRWQQSRGMGVFYGLPRVSLLEPRRQRHPAAHPAARALAPRHARPRLGPGRPLLAVPRVPARRGPRPRPHPHEPSHERAVGPARPRPQRPPGARGPGRGRLRLRPRPARAAAAAQDAWAFDALQVLVAGVGPREPGAPLRRDPPGPALPPRHAGRRRGAAPTRSCAGTPTASPATRPPPASSACRSGSTASRCCCGPCGSPPASSAAWAPRGGPSPRAGCGGPSRARPERPVTRAEPAAEGGSGTESLSAPATDTYEAAAQREAKTSVTWDAEGPSRSSSPWIV